MEYLWSPWRMEYIQSPKPPSGCVFCNADQAGDDAGALIVARSQFAYVILNRYPYTTGHLMVVPYLHCPTLEALNPETRAEMIELSSQALQVLRSVYQPQGFNLGMNIGEIAGAGVAEHVHLHVVPRWGGDTNFMSTVSATRVLPEALTATYTRIQQAWLNPAELRAS